MKFLQRGTGEWHWICRAFLAALKMMARRNPGAEIRGRRSEVRNE